LHGDRVVEVSGGRCPSEAEDLGDVALLPGLVNAHTHLEFSDCRQPIGAPGTTLPEWIGQVIAARSETTAEGKQAAIEQGMCESRAAGVRLIGEITTPPCQYPTEPDDPQRVCFAEVLGLSSQRGEDRFGAAMTFTGDDRSAGWSPHAPYSTSLALIDACIEQSRKQSRPLAMHVAESPAERELLTSASGPFADTLQKLEVWRDGLFPWGADPLLQLIQRLSLAPRALLVHGNDLRATEIEQIARNPQLTVVYCPRTHAFFGYQKHPVAELLKAHVRVALGTDSRASNPDLNLWREVQFLLRQRSDLPGQDVIRMATLNGADALGRSDIGRIEVGCRPGLGSVATAASKLAEVHADLAINEFRRIPSEQQRETVVF
jgi:cytosine/adenosine deaminase-related metal-dependent hydrolase